MTTPDPRLSLRPQIETQPAQEANEAFLHESLRPVLKLQNELLVKITQHFLQKERSNGHN